MVAAILFFCADRTNLLLLRMRRNLSRASVGGNSFSLALHQQCQGQTNEQFYGEQLNAHGSEDKKDYCGKSLNRIKGLTILHGLKYMPNRALCVVRSSKTSSSSLSRRCRSPPVLRYLPALIIIRWVKMK